MAFTPYNPTSASTSAPKTGGFTPYKNPTDDAIEEVRKQLNPAAMQSHPLDSFLKGSATAIGKRAGEEVSNLKDVFAGKLDPLSSGIQATAPVLGAVGDIAGEGLKSIYSALPEGVRSGVTDALHKFGQSEGGQQAVSDFGKIMDAWHNFATAHPTLAKDAKGVVDIATGLPLAAGATKAGTALKEAAPSILESAQGAAKNVTAKAGEAVAAGKNAELAKLVQSVDSAAGKELKTGTEVVKKGIGPFKKDIVPPSGNDLENAKQFATHLVKNDPATSAANLTGHIADVGENRIRPFLQANNQGFNRSQLKSFVEKAIGEKPITFTSNEGEKTYEKVVETLMNEIEKNPKNVSGLWDSRIAFDNAAKAQYPHAFEGAASGTKQAIRNVRNAVNDYIIEKTGGATDNVFKDSMAELSKAYNVRDDLLEKAGKGVGKTAWEKWLKAHPSEAKAAKYGLGLLGAEEVLRRF